MNWPGLLITAPFATVRRNQLCQVFKDERQGCSTPHGADAPHRHKVTSQLQKPSSELTRLLLLHSAAHPEPVHSNVLLQ